MNSSMGSTTHVSFADSIVHDSFSHSNSCDADPSACDETVPFKLVVKSTFIEVDEGPGLHAKSRLIRKAKTDSMLQMPEEGDSLLDAQDYQPGSENGSDTAQSTGADDEDDNQGGSAGFETRATVINSSMGSFKHVSFADSIVHGECNCESGSSSRSNSCDADPSACDETVPFKLVVKSTFIEVDEGPGLHAKSRLIRKAKTDSMLQMPEEGDSLLDAQDYQPGSENGSDTAQSTGADDEDDNQGGSAGFEADATDPLEPGLVTAEPGDASVSSTVAPALEFQQGQRQQHEHAEPHQRHRQCTEKTTVMMRNIPNNYTRAMLLEMIDCQGFAGSYDFIYLPMDFGRCANLGYAFVNLKDSESAATFWRVFNHFSDWALPTAKVCEISWSGPHQGLKAHIDRYKNSPVMHRNVPDEFKPMIFAFGVRQEFPPPTKTLKPPNFRR
eukprot:TRINITY_DN2096_c0_g1_i1.p1 TRINITY_DN2096_c0_g1~~TRINITY_DN2096_c0_g1_i1.p1  ORF type:complete len:443 (+),score=97.64 TRINITY_DN2096_c0_g1_i1:119-1447(+)